jgi:hypothetical protein
VSNECRNVLRRADNISFEQNHDPRKVGKWVRDSTLGTLSELVCIVSNSARQMLLNSRKGSWRLAALD